MQANTFIIVVAAVSDEIKDAEDNSSLQSEEAVDEEGHGGGGGREERHLEQKPSEGGHSKDRGSGFQQVPSTNFQHRYFSSISLLNSYLIDSIAI